ncbi:uncharacterized protein LOC117152488 [Bombus impatiens]|uniref:Uncharacterized protein LOC117152488 n=1 Tax=Bombus impatiens TaxID=132113 RepID=A0A6P8LMG3_BOMIM|nr:uncharacterized protein LOC117152488 [Bombus impatiens]
MWDCCRMASHAWTNVSTSILKNAWDNLLKDEGGQSLEELEIRQDIDKALEELSKIPECEGCDSIAVMNWFETNKKYAAPPDDLNTALTQFINTTMDTEANKPTDEKFEDILDDSSSL